MNEYKPSRWYIFLIVFLCLLFTAIFFWIVSLMPSVAKAAEPALPDSSRFENLLEKYYKSSPGSKERANLAREISGFNSTHKRWLQIYNNPRTGPELNRMVLDKLIETCATIEECDQLWSQIMGDHDMVKRLFEKIMTVPQTVKQLFALYKRIYLYDNGMESKVRRAILSSWATPETMTAIYVFALENGLTRFEVELVDEIKTINQPFDAWATMAVLSSPDSRLRELATDKMFSKIKSFSEAYQTLELTKETDKEEKALKLTFILSETFMQKMLVLEASPADSKTENLVFRQLLELAKTKEELDILSKKTSSNQKFQKLIAEKMKKL